VTAVPECPFCRHRDAERVGLWGGQIITAQWRCRACNSYFEAVREDFDDAHTPARVGKTPPSRS
jgi:ribosomal protein L37AE/L43A